MGLVSRVKAIGGAVKQKAATALGAIKKAPVSQKIGGVIGKIPAPIRTGAKLGGRIISPLAKIGTAVTVIGGTVKAVKAISGKIHKKPAQISTSTMARTGGKTALIAGAATAAAAGGAALAAANRAAPGTGNSQSFIEKAGDWVREHPKTTAAIVAGAGLAAAGVTAYVKHRKKKKSSSRKKKRKSTKRRSRSRRTRRTTRRTRKRHYGTERQYKRKGGLDVKYTKNGQPYVIQSNGRARFIKRSKR